MASMRVRAILVTASHRLLVIKRVRPGLSPYWVLPGGGVERSDRSREAALRREVREELGGEAEIHALLTVVSGAEEQYIYLATIGRWSLEKRSGPEFGDVRRGQYLVETLPMTPAALSSIDLRPGEVSEFIAEHLAAGRDLFSLPDLRALGGPCRCAR
jgi:8-oxo-dGTP pyrophosphatase MutT (NUDIX family)